jgi:three-Cys-motif partner protein
MPRHVFGGHWTSEKLERVRKYLCAYMRIFKNNPRAKFFTTIYVDAFAGTGRRISSGRQAEEIGSLDKDAQSLQKGSARIALEVEPSFDRYLFIEKLEARVQELETLRQEFTAKAAAIQIERGQ